jgi:hypothetical protein
MLYLSTPAAAPVSNSSKGKLCRALMFSINNIA